MNLLGQNTLLKLFLLFQLCWRSCISSDCSFSKLISNCTFTGNPEETSFLIFSSSYPGTFCNDGCCRIPHGLISLNEGFTIHGLWPESNHPPSQSPTCCSSRYDSVSVISELGSASKLHESLNKYWPALKRCQFLQYEWEKHGTCAQTIFSNGGKNNNNGMLDYFEAAVNLREKYDWYRILLSSGIKTSTNESPIFYKMNDFLNVLQSVTKTRVIIACQPEQENTNYETNGDFLEEIRICVEMTSKTASRLIDCPEFAINSAAPCKSKLGIRFPEFPKISLKSNCN